MNLKKQNFDNTIIKDFLAVATRLLEKEKKNNFLPKRFYYLISHFFNH